MAKLESLFSGSMAAFCAVYLYLSAKIGQGTMANPGAGFMPVTLGTAGLVLSLVIFFGSCKKAVACADNMPEREGLKRFLWCMLTLVVFIPVFEYLGAVAAVFALILALTKILGNPGWKGPVFLAAAVACIAYLVFVVILEVPLPMGIWQS